MPIGLFFGKLGVGAFGPNEGCKRGGFMIEQAPVRGTPDYCFIKTDKVIVAYRDCGKG